MRTQSNHMSTERMRREEETGTDGIDDVIPMIVCKEGAFWLIEGRLVLLFQQRPLAALGKYTTRSRVLQSHCFDKNDLLAKSRLHFKVQTAELRVVVRHAHAHAPHTFLEPFLFCISARSCSCRARQGAAGQGQRDVRARITLCPL